MIPGEPGQKGAIGADPGRRIKIISTDQLLHLPAAVDTYSNQAIHRFFIIIRVVFTHTNYPLPPAVNKTIRIA
jgi:hypothetical protein